MKNYIKGTVVLLSLATSLATLVGCGNANSFIPENRKTRRAPTGREDVGVIVQGISVESLNAVLNERTDIQVRVVNEKHQLFELFGATKSEVQALISDKDVLIENNHYVEPHGLKSAYPRLPGRKEIEKLRRPRRTNEKSEKAEAKSLLNDELLAQHPFVQAIANYQGVKLEGDALRWMGTCRLSEQTAPKIVIEDNQKRDRTNSATLFNLGQSIAITAQKSRPKIPMAGLEFMWVVSGPDYTNLIPLIEKNPSVNVTPDTSGLHIYSLVAKDRLGVCDIEINAFFVTDDEPYAPTQVFPDEASEKVTPEHFWHIFHVNSQAAWSQSRGDDVIISIIDTGVDYNHPALAMNIALNSGEIPGNNVDDDGNGYIDDYAGYDFGNGDPSPIDDFGHGTHVAGIAASNLFGAARKAKILPIKFGTGLSLGFDIASVTGAIYYSVDRGAKVLNMSFGWTDDYQALRQAMNYAEQKDVLILAAAGNGDETGHGISNDVTPSYPCNYPNKNILSIASTDEHDALTFYSNFGQSVHLAAPGGTPQRPIMSTYKKNAKGVPFVGLMGTSMATPLVAGVAAQVWAANPSLSATDVRQILLATGRQSPKLSGRIQIGVVVDALAAVQYAAKARLQ